MKQVWLSLSCVAAVMAFAAPAAAACGDFRLDMGEACDDGNVTAGDGCSTMCAVESGFVCEDIFFTLDGTGDLGVGGDEPANWVLDADNRGVRETTNSHAAVYSTVMPAQVGEIEFDVRVETTNDNDFWGWTIGYDLGELSATSTPAGTDFLFFSWKQQQQTASGADRHSGLGMTRVTGTGSAANYWLGSGGNLTMLAESTNYPIDESLANNESTNGWDDNRWYRVNLIVTSTRVRVWIREGNTTNTADPTMRGFPALNRTTHLEFDVTTTVPPGTFGLYAFSQPNLRFDLVSPQSDSICARDFDGDGVVDASDLDSDRDGVLDLVEMPGFTGDPDNDTDLDGTPDWRDPNNVPGGCTASMGVCTTLPAALDVDGDGVPNHRDRDSDGDGVPDTIEAGLTDVTADGVPDACVSVTSVGVCVAGGLAGGTLPPNTDGRGGANFLDRDSDADGIPDALEAGLTDANFNGAPDACASVTAFGLCVAGGLVGAAALPNSDMNGTANYADRDSDGDGITDAREAGLLDANGDGVPNACTADVASGLCNAGGLAGAFPSTDGDGIVDYLDVDSDGDGLNDTIEAYDTDGNQVTNRPPVGVDTDSDGIDNAFDPDCVMAVCGGTIGAPVLGVLTAAQDANGDGTPDWLTVCGDGYRTGTEPCDDGNTSGADTCTNACLVTLTNPCTTSPQCDSGICNTTSMTCATCVNNSPTGTDTGCNAALPACVTSGANSMCVECDVTAQCGAEVCSSSNLCEVCIDSGAGTDTGCSAGTPNCIGASGARQCVQCTSAAQCNDGVACTTDACTANACVNTPVTTGGMGSCTGGQVCSGAPTNLCVTCTDTSAMGTDAGCMAGVPHCRTTGNGAPVCEPCLDTAAGSGTDLGCGAGTPYCVTGNGGANSCVACVTGADCSDNNTCTTDVCTAGVCSNPAVSTGTSCTGGVCNGTLPALCEVCIDSGSGTDTGCNAASPHCIGASGSRQCVPCTTAAHCNDSVACTTDACTANACVNTPVTTGGTGSCTGGQVCSGAPTNTCVTCTDTSAMGTDAGCMAGVPHCRTTGNGAPVCEPCLDTAAGSGTDLGCGAGTPYCVTGSGGANSCVACLTGADCSDNNTCTTDVCTAGVCSNPAVSTGTSCTGGVCNGTLPALCEVCIDSGAGTDTGCSAGTPNCIGASGARQCVQCTSAAQCNDGVACTTDACTANACVNTPVTTGGTGSCTGGQVCSGAPTNTCVTCTDTSAMGTDAGCMNAAPHCRTSGTGSPVCEPCINTLPGSAVDLGCVTATPYCVTGGNGANSCVACLTGADCSDNNTCTTDVCTAGVCSNPPESTGTSCAGGVCDGAASALCEVCIDSGSGTDTGCNAASPHCIGASGSRECVPCTTAAHCDDSVACTDDACVANACTNTSVDAGDMGMCTGGQVCSGAPGDTCVPCADTETSGTDAGCMDAAPFCDVSVGGANTCEVCVDGGAGTDPGCGNGTPNCVVGTSGANECVSCVSDAECSDGNECTNDVCTTGMCTNPALSEFTPCSTGVCTAASVCSMVAVTIDGPVDGSTITDPMPTLTGTGTPGTTVSVSIGGIPVGTALVGANGTWSLPLGAPLADGPHMATATVTVGQLMAEDTTGFIVDTGTVVAITEPADGSTILDSTPLIRGTGEPGATVVVSLDGNELGTVTVDMDGNWMLAVVTPLINDTYTIEAVATDDVGNMATATSTFAIASDTDVDITGPADGALISDDTPTITGTSLPNASIEVSIEIDGTDVVIGTVTANGDGVWTIDVTNPLADGPYFVTATATDLAGNMAADTSSFTVDTETFVTIETADPTTGTITGTGEPGAEVVVTVDGSPVGTVVVGQDGTWSLDTDGFDVGEHTVTATATDPAGNTATDTETVTVTAPDAGLPDAGTPDGGVVFGSGGLSGGALCATHTPTGTSWPAAAGLLLVGLALAIRRR